MTHRLVRIGRVIPDAIVDLKYATADNFMGEVMYREAYDFLLDQTLDKLAEAADLLRREGYRLVIWDAYRPLEVQRQFYERIGDPRFVAPPVAGRGHNSGRSVDVSLADERGNQLDMPTPFDTFSDAARADRCDLEEPVKGRLRSLQKAMTTAGFEILVDEWWHFNDPEEPLKGDSILKMDYLRTINDTLADYFEGDYEGALERLEAYQAASPVVEAQILNFWYAIESKRGNGEKALALFKEALEDQGLWYDSAYLLEDEDLETLRKEPDFEALLELNRSRERGARETAQMLLAKHPSAGEEKGLLITLHGDQLNNRLDRPHWEPASLSGYAHHQVQSDTLDFAGGHLWSAPPADVEKIAGLVETGGYDRVVYGAFSSGAGTVLWGLMKGTLEADAVILVAPWAPWLEDHISDFGHLADKGISVTLICGSEDEDCLEHSETLADILEEEGIDYTYHLIEGLDHAFPEDFETYLTAFLKK